MKKSRDFGSCLDLLLDTMCNAFGGIIFIAISLTVMLTLVERTARALPASAEPLPSAVLRKKLAAIEAQSRTLTAELRMASADPQHRLAAEVAALETECRNRELRLAVQRAAVAELQKRLAENTAATAPMEQELNALQDRNEAEGKAVAILQQTLASLRQTMEQEAGTPPLQLARLRSSRTEPCFFAVWQNRLWAIGPERDASGKPHPNPATVEYREEPPYFYCQLRPEAGIPLAAGAPAQVDPALLRKLRMAGDRVPCFWVAPDSAGLFFQLHHQLRNRGIRHSWRPRPDPERFIWEVRTDVTYEY